MLRQGRQGGLLAATVFSLVATSAWAGEPQEHAKSAQACPAIFGAQKTREANAARRASLLFSVDSWPGFVEIEHANPSWTEPFAVTFPGLSVVGVEREGKAHTLLVHLAKPMAGCEVGTYRLHTDDAIGKKARVLAVHRGGALVEVGTRLREMRVLGQRASGYRLIWRSAFELVRAPAPVASSSPATISPMKGRALGARSRIGTPPLQSTVSPATKNLMKMRSERVKERKGSVR